MMYTDLVTYIDSVDMLDSCKKVDIYIYLFLMLNFYLNLCQKNLVNLKKIIKRKKKNNKQFEARS